MAVKTTPLQSTDASSDVFVGAPSLGPVQIPSCCRQEDHMEYHAEKPRSDDDPHKALVAVARELAALREDAAKLGARLEQVSDKMEQALGAIFRRDAK